MNFARRLVYHKKHLIDFGGRPYLPAIYATTARNLVLRASRQVEKSTFLALTILYLAATYPGIQILYVCPRMEQARLFARTRLMSILANSPLLRQVLIGNSARQPPVTNMLFANGSALFVRAAYRSADSVRGIAADVLLIDEFQDVAAGDLPVLQETLSHAKDGRTILCGTPKLIDNHLDAMFSQSTANEWKIHCSGCGHDAILDERSIGPSGIMCPQCQAALDKLAGRWVPRNPQSTWGEGYWVNALMVPWKKNHDVILECQRTYDFARFRNEVLGIPVSLGDHIVTRQQLEACCTDQPMAQSIKDVPREFRKDIIAGIDWGGGGIARTAVVIGFVRPEGVFEICHFARLGGREEPDLVKRQVADLCQKFQVRWIGADGLGNGSVYNRLLLDSLKYRPDLYALLYSTSDSEPCRDGVLMKWSIARTGSIGHLFSCIHKQKIRFPNVAECGAYLDEFAGEVAEYDDKNRCVKYTHPATQPDDSLHAANYALQIASRGLRRFTQAGPRD
jgi:Phage terminase large subunit (GpA)